jgi:hypothetical protein
LRTRTTRAAVIDVPISIASDLAVRFVEELLFVALTN